jgi:hypothetical protein
MSSSSSSVVDNVLHKEAVKCVLQSCPELFHKNLETELKNVQNVELQGRQTEETRQGSTGAEHGQASDGPSGGKDVQFTVSGHCLGVLCAQ